MAGRWLAAAALSLAAQAATAQAPDPALQAEVLARLPPVFEAQARDTREHLASHFVPPLSAYDLRFHPETRRDGKHMVTVYARCDASRPGALPPGAPTGSRPEACAFAGAYDVDAHRFVYFSISYGGLQPAYESAKIDCGATDFHAVTQLAALPADMRDVLQNLQELADNGGKYQATDLVVEPGLPMRRFALAEIGGDRAIVAVEHGGLGSNLEIWSFERRDGRWDGEPRWLGGRRPNSGQDLLSHACANVPFPPTRGLGTADLVHGYDNEDGSRQLVVVSLTGLGDNLRLDASGRIFGFLDASRPLSAQERRDLRQHLLALRGDVLPDRPAYGYLSQYLAVLERDPAP